jgi:hypothetical protein
MPNISISDDSISSDNPAELLFQRIRPKFEKIVEYENGYLSC